MARAWCVAVLCLTSMLGCRGEQSVRERAIAAGCDRYATLCGANREDRAQCRQSLAQVQGQVNIENAGRTARCMTEARSCGEATGCVAGGAIRAGAGFLQDFANGLTR
ncbi:MAG: hypothetical protein Q8Q09_17280 [Deltaproteobacteria bacterium]|nr:hypothetical protein [Deltaproteobacteria bacterium]